MRVESRFPWVAASVVVALLLLAVGMSLPLPDLPRSVQQREILPKLGLARINLENATELLTEKILAYDPAPLFIPTSQNSNEPEMAANSLPGGRGPFGDLEVQFYRSGPNYFQASVNPPGGTHEGLGRMVFADSLLALGRADEMHKNLTQKALRFEAFRIDNGNLVLSREFSEVVEPSELAWQPIELVGVVSRTGLVGDLVVAVSSGSNEIDDNFRFLLQKNVLIGNRLPVGFYTFRIGR